MKITTLIKKLLIILNHPLNRKTRIKALAKYLHWKMFSIFKNEEKIIDFCQQSNLYLNQNDSMAQANYYCGLYDYSEMLFLLHFLRGRDLFVDVGANIGVYTILASKEKNSKSIAIEPITETYNTLRRNINLNNLNNKVTTINIGISNNDKNRNFVYDRGAVNRVALPHESNIVTLPTKKLDDIIKIDRKTVVKIDVEGYETPVIEGMAHSLSNDNLLVLFIETKEHGLKYGFNEQLMHKRLLSYGFSSVTYDPINRKLNPIKQPNYPNTIYLRNLSFVKKRLINSDPVYINKLVI